MRYLLPFACIVALSASACGDSNSPSNPSAGTGTLNLRLTDSPFTDAKAVLVTFSEVSAHPDSGDWTTLAFADAAAKSRTCDLKKLQGPTDILGTGPLAAGQYTQIRLVVSSAAIYFDNATDPAAPACATSIAEPAGKKANLTIPSGEVKLNRGFEVPANGTTTIEVDFDGDKSIHETGNGNYMMSPVIAIKSVQ
jgi:uncharacterized protein DUF4382